MRQQAQHIAWAAAITPLQLNDHAPDAGIAEGVVDVGAAKAVANHGHHLLQTDANGGELLAIRNHLQPGALALKRGADPFKPSAGLGRSDEVIGFIPKLLQAQAPATDIEQIQADASF